MSEIKDAQDRAPALNYEPLTISTEGEIKAWLAEITGSTPETAKYIDELRSIIDKLSEKRIDQGDEYLYDTALTLAGAIGRRSEKRFQRLYYKGKGAEIPGISPIRDVNDEDITLTLEEFNPKNPDAPGYALAPSIIQLHNALIDDVNEERGNATN